MYNIYGSKKLIELKYNKKAFYLNVVILKYIKQLTTNNIYDQCTGLIYFNILL